MDVVNSLKEGKRFLEAALAAGGGR